MNDTANRRGDTRVSNIHPYDLGEMNLRANNVSVYAADIRKQILADKGRPPQHHRKVFETWGPSNTSKSQTRVYSLRD